MAKDPAFLFYSSDFLAGIQDLTMEERGQYITLLCLQHQKGHLSEKMIGLSVGNAAADVLAKFRQDAAGLWYNIRLDEEIEKRKFFSAKQSERAKEGWKTRKQKEDTSPGNAPAMPVVNENVDVNVIKNISKELCKIFGKEYLEPKERMPALANWFKTIEHQAEIIASALSEEEAIKQIRGYLKYCKEKDRKVIGTDYKVSETILSSNWLELLGENKTRAPNKYENAEYNKTLWTVEAWEQFYQHKLLSDPEFRKHFGYGELFVSKAVG